MTIAEGLIFWPCIFALLAGAIAFLRRGAFYAMAKPEPGYSERRQGAVRHTNQLGYKYLAASFMLMLFVALFLAVAEF
jgi:hypothetical protein